MLCCAACFGDRGLRKNIFPIHATEHGECGFCASDGVPVLQPILLMEYFELLISAYRLDEDGKALVEWFREDWGLFDHARMDNPRAKELLGEVLNNGEIVRKKFAPAMGSRTDRLGDWNTLRDELRHHNRFFPSVNIDLDRLKSLLSRLIAEEDELPTTWYRARIQLGDKALTGTEMGAPPPKIASHGRANPAGIPYLYLGSTPKTAISEVRPHTGEKICVADFSTERGLKFVDLRSPRKTVSPFLLEDADDICRMRNDLPFLELLGAELTRPVVPQSAAIEYTPSQYLCEFIKKCGYDGVIYRSSITEGMNLAMFRPERAEVGGVEQYLVSSVSVDAVKSTDTIAGQ